MGDIVLRFPDGSQRSFPRGVTAQEVAASLSPRLAQAALAAMVDGQVVDLNRPITQDTSIRILTWQDPEGRTVYRHSTAHIMAQAVQRLFPEAKVTIGPPTEDGQGYYYDFDVPRPFTPADLEKIEQVMRDIIAEDQQFIREEVSREQARAEFEKLGEPYKLEILDAIPEGETVSLYRNDDKWVDLCRGPHVPRTSYIKAIKLTSTSGAYWRGDEKNKMLQRIYGTSFASQKELDEYLRKLEEAQRRDHRRLGRELNLFMFHPYAPASPFFFPHGALVYNLLVDYVRGLYKKYGYEEVITPQIFLADLWKISGHYYHFWDEMFSLSADEREYGVKAMNCPSHCLMYAASLHSYRELPIRYADFCRLHRYERSGVTAGLTRVRSFSQDDAHIFCRPEQIEEEIHNFVEMLTETYKMLGFEEIQIYLSTRPDHRAGTDEIWDRAEATLADVLKSQKIDYDLRPGEGAFYGPKIDFIVNDALGRPHQLGTAQLDFNMPNQFGLEYISEAGTPERPVMIHRAMLGSLERFMGILIEHCAGAFPVWLAPVQVAILPIADRHNDYAFKLASDLRNKNLRVTVNTDSAKTSAKVAQAEAQKIPYMLIVGDREVSNESVSVRQRGRKDLGSMKVAEFEARILAEVATRASH
jgi:threonyl-tRNA synthetase